MKPTQRLSAIIWEDAVHCLSEEFDKVQDRDDGIVQTYGLLIKTKRYHIVMTHNGGDKNDGNCDFMRIPNSLVRKVYTYGPVKKKR